MVGSLPRERTRDTAHKISKWSFQFVYVTYNVSINVFNRKGDNVFNRVSMFSGPMLHPKYSIERKTDPVDRAMDPNMLPILMCSTSTSTKCFYPQGSGPMVFAYIMWPHWKETISHFCDTLEIEEMSVLWNFSGIKGFKRSQRNQLSVQWNLHTHTHTLRLVSLWGHPEHTLLPNTLHTLQETATQPREATLQPRDFRGPALWPWGCPTAQRLPLQSPQHTQHTLASGTEHTHGTQHTQSAEQATGARLQDYKTEILPANRKHNAQKMQNTEKALDGKYREIAQRRQIQRKSLRKSLAKEYTA